MVDSSLSRTGHVDSSLKDVLGVPRRLLCSLEWHAVDGSFQAAINGFCGKLTGCAKACRLAPFGQVSAWPCSEPNESCTGPTDTA